MQKDKNFKNERRHRDGMHAMLKVHKQVRKDIKVKINIQSLIRSYTFFTTELEQDFVYLLLYLVCVVLGIPSLYISLFILMLVLFLHFLC